MSDNILKIENVSFSYESSQWTLSNISFDISPGKITAIVGPNGSGKSTFIKIAAGILTPASGKVFLNNKNIEDLSRKNIARIMGYLPQGANSVFNYRVEEVVAMGRYAHLKGLGFMTNEDLKRINNCLEMTDTVKYRNRVISQLSGGERQRVMLASVLCQEPKVLLLDEPTTGLDIHHQVSFFTLLKKLSGKGLAVAVVTHDLNLASMFCDEIMLLSNGSHIKTGTVEQVINNQVLKAVYPDNVFIGTHPANGKPMVLPTTEGTCNEN